MAVTSRLALPLPQASDGMAVSPPAFFTTWSNVDPAIGPTVCTSTTRPASPYSCQWIWQSDTNEHFIWDPVANAWVKISSNPTGIVGINSSANNTSIPSPGVRYLCTAINGMTVEANRNYRIHVEGIFGFQESSAPAVSQTPSVSIHVATSGSITTTSTNQQTQYCDAYSSDWAGNGAAQVNFAFDTEWNSGNANTYLSAGWSVKVAGTFNSGSSGLYVKNTLMYVERC